MHPMPMVLDIRERPEGGPVWVEGFPRAGQLPAGCRHHPSLGLIDAEWSQAKKNMVPGIGKDKPVFCWCIISYSIYPQSSPVREVLPCHPSPSKGPEVPRGEVICSRSHGQQVAEPFQSQVCLMPVPSSALECFRVLDPAPLPLRKGLKVSLSWSQKYPIYK